MDATAAYRGSVVCVTGGAGFIGSHLCDALARSGAQVRVIDDLSNGRVSNLDGLEPFGVRLVRGSLLDAVALERAISGADVVFHEAAIASVPRSIREPVAYAEVNATGTLRVLAAAQAAGVRRVVFASSSSVYGDQPGLPRVETLPPDVRSPYAASKAAAEHYVRAYAHCTSLSTITLRYFNIFGPRQRFDSPYAAVIPRFAHAMLRGEVPTVFGDGLQTRDFTFVDNVVHANLLAGVCDGDLRGDVVNVAYGRGTSVRDLIKLMAELLGTSDATARLETRPGDVEHSAADITRARELIGYEPLVDLREGLRRTLDWVKASTDGD